MTQERNSMESPEEQDQGQEEEQQEPQEGSDQQENDPRGEGIEGGSASTLGGGVASNTVAPAVPEPGEGQGPGQGEGSRPGKSTQ